MSSNGDYFSAKSGQGTSMPRSRRSLQSQSTSQSAHEPTLEAQTTASLDPIDSSWSPRSSHGSQRGRTSGVECTVQQSDAESARQHVNQIKRQQTERRGDENSYVDDDYYSLNPWYEHEPSRPLFGLGRPFPRTVRPGMLRGRKRTQKDQDEREHDDQAKFGPSSEILDEHGLDPGAPPALLITDINGCPVEVRKISSQEANLEEKQGLEKQDHHDPEHSQKDYRKTGFGTWKKYTSGYQSGLSPLKESDTVSSETSQTQEKQKAQSREQQALQEFYNNYRNPLARLRARFPEVPAEFIATGIYIFFGITGNLYSITYPAEKGDYQTQAWAWGLAATAGIYVGGGVSGAHMNPWFSVCFSIFRGFPWKMCLVYGITQILAGFVAAVLAWGVYRDAIFYTDPKLTPEVTGIAFYTIPQTYVSTTTAFFNNFVSSAVYTCVAFAIGDDSNTPPGSGMSALIYGLMTYLLSITMGYNGLSISPARDLGPRCVAWWVGYGRATFSTGWWAYGPIATGLSGTIFGALIYDVFIFVGGESPVNYRWPTSLDIKERLKAQRKRGKEKLPTMPKLPV